MSSATMNWPDLDAPPRVVFDRTPLALALCQVRFSPILSVSDPIAVAPFQQAIQDDYPLLAQEQNINIHLEGPPNQATVQSRVSQPAWRFSDEADTWTVVLTPEFIGFETRAYPEFTEFQERLERILKALTRHIRPTVGQRIGLRYINEIRPGHSSWATVIRRELLGLLALPTFADFTSQSVQQVQLKGPGGVGVTIQHGSIPSGTVVQPRPDSVMPEDPFYLLDIDVYQEFRPGTMQIKPTVICDHVERYHDIISSIFRWSVLETYTSTLGRRN